VLLRALSNKPPELATRFVFGVPTPANFLLSAHSAHSAHNTTQHTHTHTHTQQQHTHTHNKQTNKQTHTYHTCHKDTIQTSVSKVGYRHHRRSPRGRSWDRRGRTGQVAWEQPREEEQDPTETGSLWGLELVAEAWTENAQKKQGERREKKREEKRRRERKRRMRRMRREKSAAVRKTLLSLIICLLDCENQVV